MRNPWNLSDYCVVESQPYIYIYIIKAEHNDDFNERTNTLLYKNMPLTLYSRKGCECWWAAQQGVAEGPSSSVWHLFSNWNCNSNSKWLKPSVASGYIIVWHLPASCWCTHLHRSWWYSDILVLFLSLIYTGASLDWRFGRGSVCNNRTVINHTFIFTFCTTNSA